MNNDLTTEQRRVLSDIQTQVEKNGGYAAWSPLSGWPQGTIAALERKGLIERVGDEIILR